MRTERPPPNPVERAVILRQWAFDNRAGNIADVVLDHLDIGNEPFVDARGRRCGCPAAAAVVQAATRTAEIATPPLDLARQRHIREAYQHDGDPPPPARVAKGDSDDEHDGDDGRS